MITQNKKNVIINLPTGTGKNSVIIYSFEEKKKYLILVPRIILMDQLKDEIIKHKPSLKNKIQLIGDSNNTFDAKYLMFNDLQCFQKNVLIVKFKITYNIFMDEKILIYGILYAVHY